MHEISELIIWPRRTRIFFLFIRFPLLPKALLAYWVMTSNPLHARVHCSSWWTNKLKCNVKWWCWEYWGKAIDVGRDPWLTQDMHCNYIKLIIQNKMQFERIQGHNKQHKKAISWPLAVSPFCCVALLSPSTSPKPYFVISRQELGSNQMIFHHLHLKLR